MNKIRITITHNRLMIFIVLCCTLSSCAPKLTFTEIEKRVNSSYIAFNENDIEYSFNNTPVKYVKDYGEEGYRKKLQRFYESRKKNEYPPLFSDVPPKFMLEATKDLHIKGNRVFVEYLDYDFITQYPYFYKPDYNFSSFIYWGSFDAYNFLCSGN